MFPERYEYLALLVAFQFLVASLFGPTLKTLIRTKSYWIGQTLFILFCTGFELVALKQGWWLFVDEKTLGICAAGIPAEEFGLMLQIYAALTAAWERFADELE